MSPPSDINPQIREEEEIRRLEKDFQDQHFTILVRHPTHNDVAEGKFPIIYSKDCIDVFEASHPLTVHRVLPVSEYERCEVALQMPGGLNLLVNRGYTIFDKVVELREVETHHVSRGASAYSRALSDFRIGEKDINTYVRAQ